MRGPTTGGPDSDALGRASFVARPGRPGPPGVLQVATKAECIRCMIRGSAWTVMPKPDSTGTGAAQGVGRKP